MSTPEDKPKRSEKAPDGKVVIGKNVPFHWGKNEIAGDLFLGYGVLKRIDYRGLKFGSTFYPINKRISL